jgi:hypothetical protein
MGITSAFFLRLVVVQGNGRWEVLGGCSFFFLSLALRALESLKLRQGFASPVFSWLGFGERMKLYISQGLAMPF